MRRQCRCCRGNMMSSKSSQLQQVENFAEDILNIAYLDDPKQQIVTNCTKLVHTQSIQQLLSTGVIVSQQCQG